MEKNLTEIRRVFALLGYKDKKYSLKEKFHFVSLCLFGHFEVSRKKINHLKFSIHKIKKSFQLRSAYFGYNFASILTNINRDKSFPFRFSTVVNKKLSLMNLICYNSTRMRTRI